MKKVILFVVLVIIIGLIVSFGLTYNKGGNDVLTTRTFETEHILIKFFKNEEEQIVMYMGSSSSYEKVAIYQGDGYNNSFYSSAPAPGYSSSRPNDFNFNMRTYKKWLNLIWLPYQTFEVEIDKEELPLAREDEKAYFEEELNGKASNK